MTYAITYNGDVDSAYMPACIYTVVLHQDAVVAPGDGDALELHQDAGDPL